MLFERLLVATDDTPEGEAAVEVGRRLAERYASEVLLVEVESGAAGPRTTRDALLRLEEQAGTMRARGVATEVHIEQGRTADEIARAADEQRASLAVLAHRPRQWFDAVRHPSVTARLLAHAHVPLFVWPATQPPERAATLLQNPADVVLVPLDGSATAERALPHAIDLARRTERPLLLVRVVVPESATDFALRTGYPFGYAGAPVADLAPEHEARDYLRDMRERLARETALQVQAIVQAGNAADEIARTAAAHPGSVLVLSTHGRGGIGRALLGSVTAELLDRAAIPAIVIPPAQPRAEKRTPVVARHDEPVPVTPAGPLF